MEEIKEVKKTEEKEAPKAKVDVKKFKNRLLSCINKMDNEVKADNISRRVLRNK